MTRMLAAVRRLMHRDDGQDLIRYGLLVALIALVCPRRRHHHRQHHSNRLLSGTLPGRPIPIVPATPPPALAWPRRSICGRARANP